MSSSAAHLIPARLPRRFFAGLLNVIAAGLVVVSASAIVDGCVASRGMSDGARLLAVGGFTALWLFSLFRRLSLGALFCLLEIRTLDGARPSVSQVLIRTAPFYVAMVNSLVPVGLLPVSLDLFRMLALLSLLIAMIVSSGIALFTERSIFDHISKTVVLQLKLPDEAMPRVLGFRIW